MVHSWAPGRINLIGEHVDHSGGLVLPATIDRAIHMWLAPAEAGHVVINTTLDQTFDIDRGTGTGRPALHGLLLLMADRVREIPPFRLLIEGDLPMGAGLSASAAFSVAFLHALDTWLDIGLAPWDIVDLARDVEVRFLGLECGIIGEKIPGIDMISLGPTIENPHSPDERVHIESVERFFTFVKAFLEAMAKA